MKQTMKEIRILFSAICISLSLNAAAQNEYDAFTLSQQYNEGTARSVAMGNAMTALGGDMGAIAINPAASGVYRFNELVLTPAITVGSNTSNYLGVSSEASKTRMGLANFGFIGTFNTWRKERGLLSWNFGVAFNKLNNYTDNMTAMGRNGESSWLQPLAARTNGVHATRLDYNDRQDPFYDYSWNSVLAWNTSALDTLPDSGHDYIATTENIYNNGTFGLGGELDQYYNRWSVGNTSQIDLNFGGNISNKVFFGVNLGVLSIYQKYYECYSEWAVNVSDFQTGFSSFLYEYMKKTTGTGVNLRAGVIVLPVKGLRLGASISTPTWMFLKDEYQQNMSTEFSNGDNPYLTSPLGEYDYRLNTPFRWTLGAAYVFGKAATLSVDYENVNYSQMKLEDEDYPGYFNETNKIIKNVYTTQNILRVGGEVKINSNIAARAGYQYYSSGEKSVSRELHIGSVGLGYTADNGIFADIAGQFKLKQNNESFALYDDIYDGNELITAAPVGTNKSMKWKILFSIGLRF